MGIRDDQDAAAWLGLSLEDQRRRCHHPPIVPIGSIPKRHFDGTPACPVAHRWHHCAMGFFPPISVGAPTFKDSPQDPMPWEQGFGKTAITDVLLAEDSEGAVLLRSVIAYPSVMTLDVTAQLRQPLLDGPGTRGHNSPSLFARTSDSPSTGLVLFGLTFQRRIKTSQRRSGQWPCNDAKSSGR